VSARRKRVAVVDDEPDFAAFVAEVVEGLGHYARTFSSGPAALEAVSAGGWDAVVLDIVMPEMDGIEMLRALAARGFTGQVFLITGYNPHYSAMAATLAEVQGFARVDVLGKPVRARQIEELLR